MVNRWSKYWCICVRGVVLRVVRVKLVIKEFWWFCNEGLVFDCKVLGKIEYKNSLLWECLSLVYWL